MLDSVCFFSVLMCSDVWCVIQLRCVYFCCGVRHAAHTCLVQLGFTWFHLVLVRIASSYMVVLPSGGPRGSRFLATIASTMC